ncbi:MAG: LolA family protein [Thermodesulfovibrionales bacterium]
MKNRGLVFFCISLIISVIPLYLFAIEESLNLVDRIENAYKNISDIKGKFKQVSYLKDLEKRETYEGEFFIKIPSLFKWSYKGKSPQDVIISGDTLIIYQKKEKQVLKGRFYPSKYGQAPIALLGGFGNIKRDFEIKEQEDRLILTPKAQMGNVKSIELYSGDGDFPIKRLKITDSAMNIIDIKLEDVVINSGLQDKVFEFVPPQGVRVIEGL